MAGSYRHQALIDAPVEDVWAVVSDPRTHPEWWPDVVDVRLDEPLVEGGEYVRSSKMLPFLDAVEAVWVAERLEDLKEARFRCTKSGTWASFSLTSAQGQTFVDAQSGMDPTTLRWRVMKAVSGSFLKDWIVKVLDALPKEVVARRPAARE
jgi:polyketide cyclase/dehydrase/lipid transport protein